MMHNNLIGVSGHAQTGKDLVGTIIQWLIFKQRFTNTFVLGVSSLDKFIDSYGDVGFDNISTWEVKKFADKMKDIVCLLIGCTREQLEDPVFKASELGEEWRVWEVSADNKRTLFSSELEAKKAYDAAGHLYYKMTPYMYIMTPRLLLQLLGTECGRCILHPDIWVNATFADWRPIGYHSEPIDLPINVGSVDIIDYPSWIITDVRLPNEVAAIKNRDGIVIRVERDSAPGVGEHISETALDTYTGFDYTIQNNGTIDELVEQVRTILIKEKWIN